MSNEDINERDYETLLKEANVSIIGEGHNNAIDTHTLTLKRGDDEWEVQGDTRLSALKAAHISVRAR